MLFAHAGLLRTQILTELGSKADFQWDFLIKHEFFNILYLRVQVELYELLHHTGWRKLRFRVFLNVSERFEMITGPYYAETIKSHLIFRKASARK